MSATPSANAPAGIGEVPRLPDGALAHPLGQLLPTAYPGVGVLVEPQQRRVIATQPFPAGATVMCLEGRETEAPTKYSVQIGSALHLDPYDLIDDAAQMHWRGWMFLNHHCEPNAALRDRTLVALRAIDAGEGVTFDYNTTEWDMAEPFTCHCGSAHCVGVVRGAKHRVAP